MVSVKKFIAKQPKKRKAVYAPEPITAQELQSDYSVEGNRSRELYLLYASVQRRYGKWVMPYRKDKRMRTCFQKLAKKLDELAALGLDIDEITYIMAHKATYGVELRPNHLISWCSLGIYQSYLTEKNAEVIELSEDEQRAYDDDNISYLASIRGESKEDVAKLLESCDLL